MTAGAGVLHSEPMTELSPVRCPLLVGRDDLLELADRGSTTSTAGHGQFLLLAGSAGIGKTRLPRAIWPQGRGPRVPRRQGSIAPRRTTTSRRRRSCDLARAMAAASRRFARARRDAASTLDDAASTLEHARRRRVRRWTSSTRILAVAGPADGPVFEDLQWADDAEPRGHRRAGPHDARPAAAAHRRLPLGRGATRDRASATGARAWSPSGSPRRSASPRSTSPRPPWSRR